MACNLRVGEPEAVPWCRRAGDCCALGSAGRSGNRELSGSGNERILITFSAGVTPVRFEENGSEAINRADRAMYLAKRAGKNRVVGG